MVLRTCVLFSSMKERSGSTVFTLFLLFVESGCRTRAWSRIQVNVYVD